ncbi:alpha/beta fold hydrolase [Bordetella genomosp. 11]|uniref:Alpha/beta hydrolase n=1 Tax=Bordetella genomosp. 11 TaxID=1416808 RepID=A0A261UL28_9BORD|nr:alpha/beta hydrolase [Bordetella genomosp. 11]OZI62237.1 alpha/beta hydrolase [Bordetella genomosp. 11]
MSADYPFPIHSPDPAEAGLAHAVSGNAPPLLLVHGSLCDLRYWKAQAPALSRDFRVYAVSLPGYWPAGPDADLAAFSVENHATALAAFIDRHCGGSAHVVGHSRGGRIAFELARRHPGKVRGLVLADPGLMLDERDDSRDDFRRRALDCIQAGNVEQGLALFIDTVSGADTWRRMVPWFKEMAIANAHTLAAQAQEAPYVLTEKDARAVTHPTLLIGGALSPHPYPAILDALQNWLPHAQSLRIAGSSHGMNLGNPRAFNEAVRRFLAA